MAGARVWHLGGGRVLALDRARIVAVLNVTPDSFSDGGSLPDADAAARAALEAVAAGADAIDLGGESTRPGAVRVSAEEQIRRVVPALRAIRDAGVDAPISVDTTLCAVAAAALDAGADAINDVSAGREDPGLFGLAADRGAGLVLMHRLRAPGEDRYSDRHDAPPDYGDAGAGLGVVASVRAFLLERAEAAERAGVAREAIAIDPGLGFGKTVAQNFELIAGVGSLVATGRPVLVGASRKSFIGRAGGAEAPADRAAGSAGAAVAMRLGGAALFRVHDVATHVQALRVADAVLAATGGL